jgi:hypothetical protein
MAPPTDYTEYRNKKWLAVCDRHSAEWVERVKYLSRMIGLSLLDTAREVEAGELDQAWKAAARKQRDG